MNIIIRLKLSQSNEFRRSFYQRRGSNNSGEIQLQEISQEISPDAGTNPEEVDIIADSKGHYCSSCCFKPSQRDKLLNRYVHFISCCSFKNRTNSKRSQNFRSIAILQIILAEL